METTILRLWLGYQTPYSLGLATTTPSQPQPEVIDLLADGITVREAGGSADWIPTIAGTKNGQWADSETANGRTPVSLPTANAIESLSLVASSVQAGRDLLSKLNRFAEIGRLFWTETAQRPLYLEWASSSGAGSQWALIYNMQAAIEQFDPLNADGEPLILSLSIEREAAWRAIAPGLPAKYWTLISRGLQPTTANPAPAGFFNFDDLDFDSGAGLKAPLYTLSTDFGDELNTNNRNFIDVAADDIPGDAPALVTITNAFSAISLNLFYAKDTNIDFGTANAFTSAGSYTPGTRRRLRFNSGDWALGAAANVTPSKFVTGFAWLGNGSTVNRTCIRLVFAAGAAGSTSVANFTAPAQAYSGGNYAVFITYRVSAANEVTVRAGINYNGSTEQSIGSYVLTRTGLLSSGRSAYLGTVSFPDQRAGGYAGNQLAQMRFGINLYVSKPGATTPTADIFDVWLMPITEGDIAISGFNTGVPDVVAFDNTGYANGRDIFAGKFTQDQPIPTGFAGSGFSLTPGIINRIYVSAPIGYEATNYNTSLNIIPRWYGVRTV